MTSTASENRLLLPYQRRWIGDLSPRKLWLASRQVGKSFALSLEAVNEALARRCDNLLLASSERQSRELMRKVKLHLRSLERLVPDTHSVPDTVRGFAGHIYLDEFAFHAGDREIWRAMYPTVTRGFKVRICSTPNGRQNMFFDLWSRDEGFSRHRTDIHDAEREGMKVDIEGLQKAIGDDEAWAQEFECRFLDSATAFIPYGMISACETEGGATPLGTSGVRPAPRGCHGHLPLQVTPAPGRARFRWSLRTVAGRGGPLPPEITIPAPWPLPLSFTSALTSEESTTSQCSGSSSAWATCSGPGCSAS